MNAEAPIRPADTIRPFAAGDAEAVAGLFQSVMLKSSAPAQKSLADYFRAHFLDGPFADPEIPSLVYVSGYGTVEGFAGLAVQPMTFEDKTLRAAIVGTLMVRGHESAPMAGARLLKQIVAGKQDITLSETAGDASLAMWRQLRGAVLDRHSLDFIRVLRPAEFGIGMLATRIGALRHLTPIARLLDRVAGSKPGPLRWTGLPKGFRPQGGIVVRPVSVEAFAALAGDILGRNAIVPVWPDDCLLDIIDEAMDKPAFGIAHLCEVVTKGGKPIGGFLLHFAGSGPARVVDILHMPGQAGHVLDAMFAHAQELGASSVRGRTTPHLLDALLSRRVLFAHESASVIDAKDPTLLAAFSEGRAHFNGLIGERWTRFIGGQFS